MANQAIPILTLTATATATLTANRFVSHAGAVPAGAANCLGVVRSSAVSGDKISVDVLGTTVVEAGAAIAANALIETNASGQAITRSAGAILGRMAPGEVASGAGQLVEIILIAN